jgi:hypothetical protein
MPSRKHTLTSQQALLISAVSLGLGLVFDFFFFEKLPGISFTLYVTLVLITLLVMVRRFRVNLQVSSVFLIPVILFFAWMVFMRAGEFVTLLNVGMTVFLLGLFVGSVFKPHLRDYVVSDYLEVLHTLPIDLLERFQKVVGDATSARKTLRHHESASQITRGILITVPILAVFVLLFSSADLVFKKYVTDIFGFHISPELLPRVFLITAVTAIFMGVFGYLTQQRAITKKSETLAPAGKPRAGLVETTILFGSLNALFLAFIVLQLTYLFGGEQNVIGQGFTYAQYARKGFFELIAVSALSFIVVLVAERMLLRKGQKHTARFKYLAGALVAQVLIIMVSAFSRLNLYESAYGFTSLRLYSHIFIVWLAVIFAVLAYKIFVDQRETTFAYLTFLSVIVLMVSVNVINVDAFVARENIDRYARTGKIDLNYLSQLSDDGVAETTRLLDVKDHKVRDEAAGRLYVRYQKLMKKDDHWQSTNAARSNALKSLEARRAFLEQHKQVDDRPSL